MPYDEPDPSDPMLMVGVELPAGAEAARELAYAFAEEFAAMGHDEAWILGMFRNPFYAGAHRTYLELGDGACCAIARECVEVWGRVRFVDREPVRFGGPAAGPEEI